MQLSEAKLRLIDNVLKINDIQLLEQINQTIESALNGKQHRNTSLEEEEEEYDAKKMSFEEWNKQFGDEQDLDTYIPEYDMTLREFRQMIYERERDEEEISLEEFHTFMENLKK